MLIVSIVWHFSVFTYNDKYKENPRFTFLRFKDKGHSYFLLMTTRPTKKISILHLINGLHPWIMIKYRRKTKIVL